MVYQVKDGELTIRKVDNLTSFGKAMNDQRVEAEDEYGTKLEFLKLQGFFSYSDLTEGDKIKITIEPEAFLVYGGG